MTILLAAETLATNEAIGEALYIQAVVKKTQMMKTKWETLKKTATS